MIATKSIVKTAFIEALKQRRYVGNDKSKAHEAGGKMVKAVKGGFEN